MYSVVKSLCLHCGLFYMDMLLWWMGMDFMVFLRGAVRMQIPWYVDPQSS